MQHTPVQSSNIASVGYDQEAKAMEVQFLNGARHSYAGVSPEAHTAFMGADSIGSYFHKHVRNNYPSERVEVPQEQEPQA